MRVAIGGIGGRGVSKQAIGTVYSAWTYSDWLMQMDVTGLCLMWRRLIHVLSLHVAFTLLLVSAHGSILLFLDMHIS